MLKLLTNKSFTKAVKPKLTELLIKIINVDIFTLWAYFPRRKSCGYAVYLCVIGCEV